METPIAEKDYYIIKGYIRQLHKIVNENKSVYDKPFKVWDTELANLIYAKGMAILKPINDLLDECDTTCIILMGGLVKIGVIRNFFSEQNRGNIINMINECKDFYIEHHVITLIKKVEMETYESMMMLSRMKHKDVIEMLHLDLRHLMYPIFVTIDKCPMVCVSMLCDLMTKERMVKIFSNDVYGRPLLMAKKYKEFYISNRVKFLIEKIAANPEEDKTSNHFLKREYVSELLSYGKYSLNSIYDMISVYSVTCTSIISTIIKNTDIGFHWTSFHIKDMVAEFKEWYKTNHIKNENTPSEQTA